MDKTTQQNLAVTFGDLPIELQDAILEANVDETIKELGVKYKLRIDQMGLLFLEVNKQMVGMIKPEDFPSHIASVLGISPDITTSLVADLNTQVFEKIRTIMKENQEFAELDEEETELEQKEKGILEKSGIQIEQPRPVSPTPAQTPEIKPQLSEQSPVRTHPNIRDIKIEMPSSKKIENAIDLDGIEVVAEAEKPKEQNLLINLNRGDLLNSIENPTPTDIKINMSNTPHVIEDKLAGAFQIPKKESVLNVVPTTEPKKSVDPYREQV